MHYHKYVLTLQKIDYVWQACTLHMETTPEKLCNSGGKWKTHQSDIFGIYGTKDTAFYSISISFIPFLDTFIFISYFIYYASPTEVTYSMYMVSCIGHTYVYIIHVYPNLAFIIEFSSLIT